MSAVAALFACLAVGAGDPPPFPPHHALNPTTTKMSWPAGRVDAWHGYKRHLFEADGRGCWVVEPKSPAKGNPWVWCMEFPDAFVERTGALQLLDKGFYYVHVGVGNTFGCPDAVKHFGAFYKLITERGLAKKGALIGVSRGGLYAYNWAVVNTDKVVCIYGDAPVCDFKSWPGGKGKGQGSRGDWDGVLKCYGFKDAAEALAYDKNPVDNLAPLVKANIPLIHVVGDADEVVPADENTAVVERRYKQLGGAITVIHKPRVGHHPHGLDNPQPVVDFIVRHTMASGARHHFDATNGRLAVDYAGYLAKHDVVYKTPVKDPAHGIAVGNGRVGAVIWNADGLTMQFTGVDATPQTALSQGRIKINSKPGFDDGCKTFEQRLNLYDGTVTVQYDADRTVTVFGDPESELMGIHVDDAREHVDGVDLELNLWDTGKLANRTFMLDLKDVDSWKIVKADADDDTIALSRGLLDPDRFGYTLAVTVDGAAFTTSKVDGRTLRISMKPSRTYTVWVACASRQNSPQYDSLKQALALLQNAKARGYRSVLNGGKDYWHAFWGRSFVQYSAASGEGDYLENLYYVSTYQMAAGARGKAPFHFINGVYRWNADDDIRWSVGYWIWNMRPFYNSFYASNHADLVKPYHDLYLRNIDANKAHTLKAYKTEGLVVPETMNWEGKPYLSQWTDLVFTSGIELALSMYDRYRYTDDRVFFERTAYPFMKQVVQFYCNYLKSDGKHYYMQPSNAHETYFAVKNPVTDLAALRAILPLLIAESEKLNLDPVERTRWKDVLEKLSPYAVGSDNGVRFYLPHDPPASGSNNGENPECEMAYPYGVTGILAPDREVAVNTWKRRKHKMCNIWAPDGVQAARLGLGDEAYDFIKTLVKNNQLHPSGICDDGNGRYEANGLLMLQINESLLQSYNGVIRVFPALPSDPSFTARFTLLAAGGFLVSSERDGGHVMYVGIKSLYGNEAVVINPWSGTKTSVRRVSDGSIISTTEKESIAFKTDKNQVYIVERDDSPIDLQGIEPLTGSPNRGKKTVAPRQLGN